MTTPLTDEQIADSFIEQAWDKSLRGEEFRTLLIETLRRARSAQPTPGMDDGHAVAVAIVGAIEEMPYCDDAECHAAGGCHIHKPAAIGALYRAFNLRANCPNPKCRGGWVVVPLANSEPCSVCKTTTIAPGPTSTTLGGDGRPGSAVTFIPALAEGARSAQDTGAESLREALYAATRGPFSRLDAHTMRTEVPLWAWQRINAAIEAPAASPSPAPPATEAERPPTLDDLCARCNGQIRDGEVWVMETIKGWPWKAHRTCRDENRWSSPAPAASPATERTADALCASCGKVGWSLRPGHYEVCTPEKCAAPSPSRETRDADDGKEG